MPRTPRQTELCRILAAMGGEATSKASVYLQLDYRGGSSNRHGAAVMLRAIRRGLIEEVPTTAANRIPVRLTEAGREEL